MLIQHQLVALVWPPCWMMLNKVWFPSNTVFNFIHHFLCYKVSEQQCWMRLATVFNIVSMATIYLPLAPRTQGLSTLHCNSIILAEWIHRGRNKLLHHITLHLSLRTKEARKRYPGNEVAWPQKARRWSDELKLTEMDRTTRRRIMFEGRFMQGISF